MTTTGSEELDAVLGVRVALAALAHSPDAVIEQVDVDVCEDGETWAATAHLADGNAVAACGHPREVELSGGNVRCEGSISGTPPPCLHATEIGNFL